MSEEQKQEQERWISRYEGLFGEPPLLEAFREGSISFRRLYDNAMRYAENMTTEAGYCQAVAFDS